MRWAELSSPTGAGDARLEGAPRSSWGVPRCTGSVRGIDDGRLGDEFAYEADAATDLILQWPDAPPPYRGRRREPMVRASHLGKFPYRLIYAVRNGEILVLAYAHEARRPGYWLHRLTD